MNGPVGTVDIFTFEHREILIPHTIKQTDKIALYSLQRLPPFFQ